MDYNSSQAATTYECVETVILHPPQDLHPDINALAALSNPSTTMNPSISDTTTLPSALSDHTPLFPYTDSDLIPFMLQQLVVKF